MGTSLNKVQWDVTGHKEERQGLEIVSLLMAAYKSLPAGDVRLCRGYKCAPNYKNQPQESRRSASFIQKHGHLKVQQTLTKVGEHSKKTPQKNGYGVEDTDIDISPGWKSRVEMIIM